MSHEPKSRAEKTFEFVACLLFSPGPRELVALSDVTEANRKPSSKWRRYNSVYLSERRKERKRRGRGEEEKGRRKKRGRERKCEREFIL